MDTTNNLAIKHSSTVATINVIADALASYEILHLPENTNRAIGWCTPYSSDNFLPSIASDEATLFMVHSGDVMQVLEDHSSSLVLLVLEPSEPFSIATCRFDASKLRRLFVIRATKECIDAEFILSTVQMTLFRLNAWNQRCDEIVHCGGNIQNLIDSSAAIFGNWIDVNDATYTLIAYTKDQTPPDALSENLVKLGCHSVEQVEAARTTGVFREWRDQNGLNVFKATSLVPFDHVTYIIKVNHIYRGHVVMVCNNNAPTPGLIDLFKVLAKHCENALVGQHVCAIELSAYEGFFINLLNNTAPSQDYVDNQKQIIGIEGFKSFCVVSIDNTAGSYSEQTMLLLSAANDAFVHAFTMIYEDAIFVLFYAPEYDSEVIAKQNKSLETFCAAYDCIAYSSSLFFGIEDLGLVYQQIKAIRKYRMAIEYSTIDSIGFVEKKRIFCFREAFCFMTSECNTPGDPIMVFGSEDSLLDVIEVMQQECDACDLKVLYYYLYNERKATPTSEQLRMHRNNVLYRIHAIEKRYNLNLDNFFTREYLLTCYRIKINNSAKFRKLLL